MFGVPNVADTGRFREIIDAIGRVGVGVALSFVAFMLGSVIDDLLAAVTRVRGARPLSLSSVDVSTHSARGVAFLSQTAEWLGYATGRFVGSLERSLERPTRPARNYAEDPEPLDVLAGMDQPVLAELERLEAAIDRLSAEVTLRLSLVLPLWAAGATALVTGSLWAIVPLGASAAFLWQISRRSPELHQNLRNSEAIRDRVTQRLRDDRGTI